MKLKTTTNITRDGVIQGLGGAEERPRNGLQRDGRAIPPVDADCTLLVPDGGQLVRWPPARDLVEELDAAIYPIVVGQGTRLFPDAGPDMALELLSSRTSPIDLTMQDCRPSGRPQDQRATFDSVEMSAVGQGKASS